MKFEDAQSLSGDDQKWKEIQSNHLHWRLAMLGLKLKAGLKQLVLSRRERIIGGGTWRRAE